MGKSVWKVFVPHDIFIQSDAFLFGHVDSSDQSVFITASSTEAIVPNCLTAGLNWIGSWRTLSHGQRHQPMSSSTSAWVLLSKSEESDLQCTVFSHSKEVLSTCIIYNPTELLKSVILCERSEGITGACDNITGVVKALERTRRLLGNYEIHRGMVTYCGPVYQRLGFTRKLGAVMLWVIACLYAPFSWLTPSNITSYPKLLRTILTGPCTLVQLGTRSECLRAVYAGHQTPVTRLKNINRCLGQVLDSLFGICLMYVLMRGDTSAMLADLSLSYGDTVAGEMKTLLHWLMGAPAGLKLNSQLTHFLAKFFQYHIHLWTGYLYLLKPVLGVLVYYASMSGVFGLTVQLALFQDIFSTLTLHIYSFYVYAARLYQLQLYALASLWRLFRGKKRNVLRQRVDSAVYDANQLFVGTLLFTVLLFLLPTAALYYIVFTLLRLVVLAVQGMIGRIRYLLNTMPVWSVWLWAIRSPLLSDGAIFHVVSTVPQHQHSTLFLSMKVSPLCLSDVLALTWERQGHCNSHSWPTFLKNLIHGDLIYPWIDWKPTQKLYTATVVQ